MQKFDFTQTGGFPLNQERLQWMQDGYVNALNAISGMTGTTVPAKLIGIELLTGDWVTGGTVSDGWVWHPALGMMPFIGGVFTPSTMGVIYQDITSPLTFANNAQQNVKIFRVANIAPGAGPDLKSLSENLWHSGFGKVARTAWQQIYTGPNLNVFALHDKLINVVYLRGAFTKTDTNFTNVSPQLIQLIDIPVALRPPREFFFHTTINPHNAVTKDFSGSLFRGIIMRLGQDGMLAYENRKLEGGAGYTIYFDISYTLF